MFYAGCINGHIWKTISTLAVGTCSNNHSAIKKINKRGLLGHFLWIIGMRFKEIPFFQNLSQFFYKLCMKKLVNLWDLMVYLTKNERLRLVNCWIDMIIVFYFLFILILSRFGEWLLPKLQRHQGKLHKIWKRNHFNRKNSNNLNFKKNWSIYPLFLVAHCYRSSMPTTIATYSIKLFALAHLPNVSVNFFLMFRCVFLCGFSCFLYSIFMANTKKKF